MRESKPSSFSPAAIAGVIMIVFGVVALGIWGPRMHQRTIGPSTNGLSDLIAVAIEDHASLVNDSFLRRNPVTASIEDAETLLVERLGSSVVLPDLTPLGYALVKAQPSTLLPDRAGAGVQLLYEQRQPRRHLPLVVYLFDGTVEWLHFDQLGRQVVLNDSTRLDDWIEYAPGSFVAVAVLRLNGTTVLLMSLDPTLVEKAVDLLGGAKSEKPAETLDSLVLSNQKRSIRRFMGATIEMVLSLRCSV